MFAPPLVGGLTLTTNGHDPIRHLLLKVVQVALLVQQADIADDDSSQP